MKCENWKMPAKVKLLILESPLLPAIEAALRSGSLLEMAKDYQMNRNFLLLVQEIARHEDLMELLIDIDKSWEPTQKTSISDLLSSLSEQNELFLKCLDKNESSEEKDEQKLSAIIVETHKAVQEALKKQKFQKQKDNIAQILKLPLDEIFLKLVKPLKMETIDMS